jgi:hypothetical protein
MNEQIQTAFVDEMRKVGVGVAPPGVTPPRPAGPRTTFGPSKRTTFGPPKRKFLGKGALIGSALLGGGMLASSRLTKASSALMDEIQKLGGMSFLKQKRDPKAKEVYKRLKEKHPEYPAGKKARIAEAVANEVAMGKGDQPGGVRYK